MGALLAMFERFTFERLTDDTRQMLAFALSKESGSGAYDAGLEAAMKNLIPNRWDQASINPVNQGIIQEKLKAFLKIMDGKLAQKQQKYFLAPDEIPNKAQAPATITDEMRRKLPTEAQGQPPVPGIGPPAPQRPVTAATAASRGETLPAGKPATSSIWTRPPGSDKRMWRGGK